MGRAFQEKGRKVLRGWEAKHSDHGCPRVKKGMHKLRWKMGRGKEPLTKNNLISQQKQRKKPKQRRDLRKR